MESTNSKSPKKQSQLRRKIARLIRKYPLNPSRTTVLTRIPRPSRILMKKIAIKAMLSLKTKLKVRSSLSLNNLTFLFYFIFLIANNKTMADSKNLKNIVKKVWKDYMIKGKNTQSNQLLCFQSDDKKEFDSITNFELLNSIIWIFRTQLKLYLSMQMCIFLNISNLHSFWCLVSNTTFDCGYIALWRNTRLMI